MVSNSTMGKNVTNKKLLGRPAITGCVVNILSSIQGINIVEPCIFVIYDKISHVETLSLPPTLCVCVCEISPTR